MTSNDLTDSDRSKVSAETASSNKKKAAKLVLSDVMLRVYKQDGVGLRPEEVWCLANRIEKADDEIVRLNHIILSTERQLFGK